MKDKNISKDVADIRKIAKEKPELIRSLPLLYRKVVEKILELDRGKGRGI